MSLVAHWRGIEGSGASIGDVTGHGYNGVITDATWAAGHRPGTWSLDFNGSSARVVVADAAGLDLTNGITISAWIKGETYAAAGYNAIAWKSGAYRFGLYGGFLYFGATAHACQSAEKLTAGVWRHVAVTYDATIGDAAAPLPTCNSFKLLSDTPVVTIGAAGKWDDTGIREIGNILYDADEADPAKRYKLTYSGYGAAYAETNVYIGYAYSADGVTWTKATVDSPLIAESAEDPYLVKYSGTYYLFVENKEAVPFRGIRLYTSTDFSVWTDNGYVFEPQAGGTPTNWEATDVSSPTVFRNESTGLWCMFYEGRGGGLLGRVGLATSENGTTWVRNGTTPILTETAWWGLNAQVPDDIVKIGDVYYLVYHANPTSSSTGFHTGLATSTNLTTWTVYPNNPLHSADTMMMLPPAAPSVDATIGFAATSATAGIKRYTSYDLSAPWFYIDGVRQNHQSGRSNFDNEVLTVNANALGLGRSGTETNYYFDGLIQDVRLYDSELSPEYIMHLATNYSPTRRIAKPRFSRY